MTSVLTTYPEPVLNEAFKRVADPSDWRSPIDVVILEPDPERRARIARAVEFYTATRAVFKRLHGYTYRVTAVGYRDGPCGP